MICILALTSALAQETIPTLVANGGFEQADPENDARPANWDMPDGLGVQWKASGDAEHGKAICIDTAVSEQDMVAQWNKKGLDQWDIPEPAAGPIAATYGLSYYSMPMPIATGQAYRISFAFKTSKKGEGGKVWVRCYGMFRGELRRRYETQVFCRVEKADTWTHFSQCFHPTKFWPEVTEMKVMLYAYWPPGEYWFDNIVIEPVSLEAYDQDRKKNWPQHFKKWRKGHDPVSGKTKKSKTLE